MTTATAEVDAHHDEHHGPTDKQFYGLFWILVVLTAIEVSTEWWGEGTRKIAVAMLFIIMIVKFLLIVQLFMHGRFDNPLLRRTFFFGVFAAVVLYTGALASLNFFEDSGTTRFDNPPPAPPALCVDGEDC